MQAKARNFELTDYKQMFLNVRSNNSKFLKKLSKYVGQHPILSHLFANAPFKFGSICSLFMINDSLNCLNHELFI